MAIRRLAGRFYPKQLAKSEWLDYFAERFPTVEANNTFVVTGGWSYIRFHKGAPLRAGYSRVKLSRWADRIASMAARDTYIYFNNDTGGAALRDAVTLTEMLAERGVAVSGPSGAVARKAG